MSLPLGMVAGVALAAAAPISFDAAVKQALELNPAMRFAAAETERASALVEQARAPSLPSLALNGTYARLDADRVLNGNVILGANQLGGSVQLQVPLVVPNRWAQWRRASANADAVKANAEDARRQTAVNAARVWLSVLGQRRVVQAQQRGVEVSHAHLTYAQDRRRGGVGNRLDELRAAQELAVARTQLAAAQGALERLQEQLGVAVGVDEALDVLDAEPPLTGPLPTQKDALEGASAARLDVLAARQRVAAARVANAWDFADYTPLLTAVIQPGYQNPPTLTVPFWSVQAQVLLTVPLYEGGLRYGQERERRALLAQAELQQEALTRQASAEVRAALSLVSRAEESLRAARDAATDSEGALTLAQDAFRAGGLTNLEVVDAERRARDAATSVALAENAAWQARLEVLAASGRFPAPWRHPPTGQTN